MKNIEENTKQSSSIHQKIRKARFVHFKSDNTETFKYGLVHNVRQRIRNLFIRLKRYVNSFKSSLSSWMSKFNWKTIGTDIIEWITETIIEGITVNFATHYLFDVQFNLMTIIAHGIIIKQSISVYWRFKKDGPTAEIPKTNK